MPQAIDPKYVPRTPVQKLGYLVEESGEVLAAAGKALRFGLDSTNVELPQEEQETNRDWLRREIVDLQRAIDYVCGDVVYRAGMDVPGRDRSETERLRVELEVRKESVSNLREALRNMDRLVERIDKAMASPERIEEDTRLVGGFVSTLNLTETAESILERAISVLTERATETERLEKAIERTEAQEQVYQEWLLFEKALPGLFKGWRSWWAVFRNGAVRQMCVDENGALRYAELMYGLDHRCVIAKVEPIEPVKVRF